MMEEGPRSPSSLGATAGEEVKSKNDDEEAYVHDQLPSIEEVRTRAATLSASADRANRVSRRRLRPPRDALKLIFYAGVFLLIVAVIILIVGLVTAGNDGRTTEGMLDRTEVETFLFSQGYVSENDMNDGNSPQHKAITWLVESDGAGSVAVPNQEDSFGYTEFLQRYVLVVLYFATSVSGWKTKWNMLTPGLDTCAWNKGATADDGRVFRFGARCIGGLVTRIQIPQTNLEGIIPKELGYLTDLTFLALHHNSLSGILPGELQMLVNLDYLALHVNQLSGNIPNWVDSLDKLRVLGLGDNMFDGVLPSAMSKLTNLVTLGLDDNEFDGNFLFLKDMKRMERLYLNGNNFGTSIDTTYLLAMRGLEELDLSGNQFEGSIPEQYFNFPKLRILDLSDNSLSGNLPLDKYDNKAMNYLTLDHNKLNGPILESMASLSNLTHFDLSGNLFTGFIPNSITTQMTALKYLFFSDNPKLTASAIPDLSALKHLEDVSFKGTQRTGLIPDYFPQSNPDLVLLDLDDNALTGTIPRALGGCPRLQYLLLNRNEGLVGQVPVEIQLLPSLGK